MKDLLQKNHKHSFAYVGELPALVDTAVIPVKMDEQFNRDGRRWRVSAIGIGFIIGTDIRIAPGGDVQSPNNIISVKAATTSRPLS